MCDVPSFASRRNNPPRNKNHGLHASCLIMQGRFTMFDAMELVVYLSTERAAVQDL